MFIEANGQLITVPLREISLVLRDALLNHNLSPSEFTELSAQQQRILINKLAGKKLANPLAQLAGQVTPGELSKFGETRRRSHGCELTSGTHLETKTYYGLVGKEGIKLEATLSDQALIITPRLFYNGETHLYRFQIRSILPTDHISIEAEPISLNRNTFEGYVHIHDDSHPRVEIQSVTPVLTCPYTCSNDKKLIHFLREEKMIA